MQIRVLPNLSRSAEKHLTGYTDQLPKPHYQHFKDVLISYGGRDTIPMSMKFVAVFLCKYITPYS